MDKKIARLSSCVFLFAAVQLTTVSAQNAPKLSDPEIASVAVTANQVDIDYAHLAKQKSKNKDVIEFAETMSRDHKAVIEQASALVKKLNVTPKDNAVSQKLNSDATKTRRSLQGKTGEAFDKAYIDNEVAYHKAVISTLETILVPQASNAELKGLLEGVVPALKSHLAHAEMVQKMFNKHGSN